LDPATVQDFEAIEGMLVTVSSGTADPLTVIENFNLDRFGEVTISAGRQVQATQLFDAQTEADAVAETIAGNIANRLLLDDGVSSQNPDEFVYLPGGSGDNGNGFLDAGDDFSDTGSTIRLGSELTEDVTGVMGFGFGEYRLVVTDQLQIDEATNSGAREAAPQDVGGTLQVASFNVLNFFTTLDNGSGGSGPNNLSPRGADNADELQRQLDKLVEGMSGTGAEVIAL
jgi:predicted extracellular nuclease